MATQPPAYRYVTAGAQAIHDYTDPLPYVRFRNHNTEQDSSCNTVRVKRRHLQNVQTGCAAQQTVPGFFPQKVKRPEREADNFL